MRAAGGRMARADKHPLFPALSCFTWLFFSVPLLTCPSFSCPSSDLFFFFFSLVLLLNRLLLSNLDDHDIHSTALISTARPNVHIQLGLVNAFCLISGCATAASEMPTVFHGRCCTCNTASPLFRTATSAHTGERLYFSAPPRDKR